MHAHKVQTPAIIQHGGADERVPLEQGLQFYTALKRRGVPVDMYIYPRQPPRHQRAAAVGRRDPAQPGLVHRQAGDAAQPMTGRSPGPRQVIAVAGLHAWGLALLALYIYVRTLPPTPVPIPPPDSRRSASGGGSGPSPMSPRSGSGPGAWLVLATMAWGWRRLYTPTRPVIRADSVIPRSLRRGIPLLSSSWQIVRRGPAAHRLLRLSHRPYPLGRRLSPLAEPSPGPTRRCG